MLTQWQPHPAHLRHAALTSCVHPRAHSFPLTFSCSFRRSRLIPASTTDRVPYNACHSCLFDVILATLIQLHEASSSQREVAAALNGWPQTGILAAMVTLPCCSSRSSKEIITNPGNMFLDKVPYQC